MLAPASPVAPVTKTVSLMPAPAPAHRRRRVSTWSGLVGDDRRARPEDVEGVDEAVQAHGVGAGEAELDDLGGGEDLAELPVDLVVDGVVVGREQVEELARPSAPARSAASCPGAMRQATSSSVIESCLRDCMQGWHSPSWALRIRMSSTMRPPRRLCFPMTLRAALVIRICAVL